MYKEIRDMSYEECIKKWRNGVKEELLERVLLKFSYSSNKIQNHETRFVDVETIFNEEEVQNFNGSKKTIKEIKNHRDLCKNLLDLIEQNNSELSIGLIKHFNYALTKNCLREELLINGEKPGEFKNGVEVEGILKSLVDEFNHIQINEDNALEIVAHFDCCFQNIHPFVDGNGRVGRMLINYLLLANNLPPIVIFYNNIEEYYLALEYFDETQDISQMVKFLDDQAYKTWSKDYNLKLKNLKEFLH